MIKKVRMTPRKSPFERTKSFQESIYKKQEKNLKKRNDNIDKLISVINKPKLVIDNNIDIKEETLSEVIETKVIENVKGADDIFITIKETAPSLKKNKKIKKSRKIK